MNQRKSAALFIGGFCAALVVVFIVLALMHRTNVANAEVIIDPEKYYEVTRVVDGDTVKAKVEGQEITIRLLGINTPETVDPRKPPECYGHEASDETKSLLTGHTVKLAYNPNREHLDKYGRYLLYVYREDGLFVNEFLVKEGYAREYTYGTAYSFQKAFRTDQLNAKVAKKGLWATCDAKSNAPLVGV